MDGWMGGQMDRWVDRWMDGCMMDGWIDGNWMDRQWMDRWKDGRTDGWMNGQHTVFIVRMHPYKDYSNAGRAF